MGVGRARESRSQRSRRAVVGSSQVLLFLSLIPVERITTTGGSTRNSPSTDPARSNVSRGGLCDRRYVGPASGGGSVDSLQVLVL